MQDLTLKEYLDKLQAREVSVSFSGNAETGGVDHVDIVGDINQPSKDGLSELFRNFVESSLDVDIFDDEGSTGFLYFNNTEPHESRTSFKMAFYEKEAVKIKDEKKVNFSDFFSSFELEYELKYLKSLDAIHLNLFIFNKEIESIDISSSEGPIKNTDLDTRLLIRYLEDYLHENGIEWGDASVEINLNESIMGIEVSFEGDDCIEGEYIDLDDGIEKFNRLLDTPLDEVILKSIRSGGKASKLSNLIDTPSIDKTIELLNMRSDSKDIEGLDDLVLRALKCNYDLVLSKADFEGLNGVVDLLSFFKKTAESQEIEGYKSSMLTDLEAEIKGEVSKQ
ncbi:MAG: hypothetical protein IBX55_00755 [Methyloprofundus sp.]|nr:hypothetical protein [Methyloprofundus sp.]